MTAGSNSKHPGPHHAIHPRDDRESLSSLFDGELTPDAARFALKRLAHDDSWRDACGRWQLIGDVLRREAGAVAPTGFADRVMTAVTADAVPVAVDSPAHPVADSNPRSFAPRRRWLGGAALAASVAVMAALVVQPFSPTGSPVSDAGLATQAAPAVTPRVDATTAVTPPLAAPQVAQVATAAVPSVVPEPADQPVPSPRVRTDVSSRSNVQLAAANRPEVIADQSATMAASKVPAAQPFHPPADPAVARPWPRAVLPTSDGAALTVGFGNHFQESGRSPSFYPFEPRLPADEPAPDEELQR